VRAQQRAHRGVFGPGGGHGPTNQAPGQAGDMASSGPVSLSGTSGPVAPIRLAKVALLSSSESPVPTPAG
jgi:hypothetical protein